MTLYSFFPTYIYISIVIYMIYIYTLYIYTIYILAPYHVHPGRPPLQAHPGSVPPRAPAARGRGLGRDEVPLPLSQATRGRCRGGKKGGWMGKMVEHL